MNLKGKKLGVLISAKPGSAGFQHGLGVVDAALNQGVDVYLYCIDDAVPGVAETRLQELKQRGLKLYACAYGAHRRNFPLSDVATFAGLTVVSDIMAGTDRFLCFN
jgi:hypothetical protein